MAFYTETQTRDHGILARAASALSQWFADIEETLVRRRVARTTYTELSSLSDRELADLGLIRCDLRRVAREAARGKL
jgi:uncharacterized protein YjiS (DUF1127 family)